MHTMKHMNMEKTASTACMVQFREKPWGDYTSNNDEDTSSCEEPWTW